MELTIQHLREFEWDSIRGIYGNAHHSLIGLTTRWWIRCKGGLVAEEVAERSKGRRDAVLLDRCGCVRGVVEAEGDKTERGAWTVEKRISEVVEFISTKRAQFGVLIVYAYEPRGTEPERRFPCLINRLPTIWEATRRELHRRQCRPCQRLGLILIEKRYVPKRELPEPLRNKAAYYQGVPSRVYGLVLSGDAQDVPEPVCLWEDG